MATKLSNSALIPAGSPIWLDKLKDVLNLRVLVLYPCALGVSVDAKACCPKALYVLRYEQPLLVDDGVLHSLSQKKTKEDRIDLVVESNVTNNRPPGPNQLERSLLYCPFRGP